MKPIPTTNLTPATAISPTIARAPLALFSARWLARCLFVLVALSIAAQVRVPVPGSPVPMTLQMLAVLMFGLCMVRSAACAGAGLYILLGHFGLPWFAAGSIGLFGPTGGYLVGFFVAAFIIATLRGRGPTTSIVRRLFAASAGVVIVLGLGCLQLASWSGSFQAAFFEGVLPFLPKAAVECLIAVAASALWDGWRGRVRRVNPERFASCDRSG